MGKDIAHRTAEFQARVARFARELSQEMFPEGLPEGMKFSELEEAAIEVGDEVGRTLIEGRVRARARSDPEGQAKPCPECGGPLREGPRRTRKLITARGPVTWTEETRRCPRCRRAFSPSRPSDGARWHRL